MNPETGERSWFRKFCHAFRGLGEGVRGQSSFFVHLLVGTAVIVAGMALRIGLLEWCILTLCIAGVITAELFNSALESMAKAIASQNDPHVGSALDIGSAAVLVAAIGAAVVGILIFAHRAGVLLWG